jgi:NADH-quinone oxidoreductase subunit M
MITDTATDSFAWLTVIGITPLVGALIIAFLPRGRELLAKQIALVASLVVLVLTAVLAVRFDNDGARFQFTEQHEWIKSFGVSYSVGVDGIALVLILLVAVLVPVVLLASWHDADQPAVAKVETAAYAEATSTGAGGGVALLEGDDEVNDDLDGDLDDELGELDDAFDDGGSMGRVKTFFGLLLVLETMMVGVFAATDVFLFYVFFEAMLIPMYFLVGLFGGPRRQYAAVKFLLFSLFGGLLMLASVIGLYVAAGDQLGSGTFNFLALTQLDLETHQQVWLFLGFFLAFAIKAPLFPFHTWLPDAGAESPVGGAVLLVGVLDKVGTFGFIRYCLPLFPDATREAAPYVLALSVIGILYGALLAMGQRDLKRLVSYTSVAHFGFIGLGVFALTTQAQTGAVLYMVNHGLSTGALFLVVGFLIVRGKSRDANDYGGIASVAPLLAGGFLLAGLSSLALPGMSTFISEFLVLVGTFTRYEVAAILATLGIVLAALYILLAYQKTMTGPLNPKHSGMKDLNAREIAALAPLIVLMVVLGFYPKPLTDIINPAVKYTQADLGFSDPPPTQHGLSFTLPHTEGGR